MTAIAGSGLRVKVVRSEREFQGFRDAWDRLNYVATEASIFTTWEWLSAAWRHLTPDTIPWVIVVEENRQLIGIAPLLLDRRWPLRVGRFMGGGDSGYSMSDYGGFVLMPGKEEQAVLLIVDEMLRRSGDWDVLDLREVSQNSSLMTVFLDEVERRGLVYRADRQSATFPVALPSTWDQYLAGLSSNMRSSLERKSRKLARDHTVTFHRVEDAVTLETALGALFSLHTDRWNKRGLPGIFNEKGLRGFHKSVASAFLDRGWLDLVYLTADATPIGAIYNFRYKDTVSFYALGFRSDEEWSRYSLGNTLLANSIRHAIEDGFLTFDMLRGDGGYKSRFNPTPGRNYRVRIARSEAVHAAYDFAERTRKVPGLIEARLWKALASRRNGDGV